MAQHNATHTEEQAEQHFFALLRKFDRAMLVTHADGVGLRGRPMAIAETGPDGSIWFLSGRETPKVNEVGKDGEVMAVMQDSSRWLAISGRAELQEDRAHVARIWKEAYRAWFTGKDDPNIVLIRLNPREAEYWDDSGLRGLKFALRFARAYVSRTSMRAQADDVNAHGKIAL